ncbi:MAG: glyoxal reductase [Epulopiscium sp. Nele67-Bin004]|nr:MAG: glyoxal reductase [Epulopiscium sp. Nele67-Bin004]
MEFTLNTGAKIPVIGLGVFLSEKGEETVESVKTALKVGYRHIDTAYSYKNEEEVGVGIKESGVNREDIFITTKLSIGDVRKHRAIEAYDESLVNLGVDTVDLYLIHWPAVEGFKEAWLDLEKLYNDKKVRAIGVSNFNIHHLETIAEIGTVTPAVNQFESHPYFNNQELVDYCHKKGIVVTAYSPLGGQKKGKGVVLADPTLAELAEKYERSVAQIILRWHLQRGVVVIPKSKSEARIIENFNITDFELSDEDMDKINSLDTGERMGSDPDNIPF